MSGKTEGRHAHRGRSFSAERGDRFDGPSRRSRSRERARADNGKHHHGRRRSTSSRRSRSRSPRRRRKHSRSRSRRREDMGEERRAKSDRRRHSRSRSRSRSGSPRRDADRHGRRHRDDGKRSRSRSQTSRSSSSDSTDDRRHRRKKEKKSRHKEKKREKKEKKKKKSGAVSHQWGKYGIISETDLYTKEQEFRAWLVEERKINPETVSKDQTKKEFARFVEDYNTATLPHEKFYHMEAYERRMSALRAGEYVPPPDDSYDPNADLRALESTHKRRAVERDTFMSKEQLQELRRVQNERIEAGRMKLLGMDVKQTMGVRMDGSMFDG